MSFEQNTADLVMFNHVKLILSFLFFSTHMGISLQNDTVKNFRCDYKYNDKVDTFFKYHRIPANWHEARLRCYLEGATLASPLNKTLNLILKEILKENNMTNTVHTGIHATFSREDFYSVEGIHLSNMARTWASTEPNNRKNEESCLTFDVHGALYDEACNLTKPYICYRKYDSRMVVNECGTVDNEYSLDPRTGSCYKFHKVPRTWSRAYMACYAEGANLLIIDNPQESEAIKDLFLKYPKSNVRGLAWKDVTYIGVHDWDAQGEWVTVNGKFLEESNFEDFKKQELNISDGVEFCGYVYRTAHLDDLWCQKTYSFICEKAPESLLKCYPA